MNQFRTKIVKFKKIRYLVLKKIAIRITKCDAKYELKLL